MVRHLTNIVHPLTASFPSSPPANASLEGDGEAAMAPLIRSDLQKPRPDHPIKSSPIDLWVTLKNLAGDRCHRGRPVVLICQHGLKVFQELVVIKCCVHALV